LLCLGGNVLAVALRGAAGGPAGPRRPAQCPLGMILPPEEMNMTHNSVCAWLLSRLSLRPALEPAPRYPAARHAHCPPAAPLLPPADPRCPIAPRLATPLCGTPRHATPRHATPPWRHATRLGDATPQWHHETPRRATPRDFKLATPRHTTLRHATLQWRHAMPCHATPRHAEFH